MKIKANSKRNKLKEKCRNILEDSIVCILELLDLRQLFQKGKIRSFFMLLERKCLFIGEIKLQQVVTKKKQAKGKVQKYIGRQYNFYFGTFKFKTIIPGRFLFLPNPPCEKMR